MSLQIEPTFEQRLDQVMIETGKLLTSPEVRSDPELWAACRELQRSYLRHHDEPPSGDDGGPMFESLREKVRSLEWNAEQSQQKIADLEGELRRRGDH
jgi:hypothetical protein